MIGQYPAAYYDLHQGRRLAATALYPMPYIVYIEGMEIVLPVTAEHCIETATRRAHRRCR